MKERLGRKGWSRSDPRAKEQPGGAASGSAHLSGASQARASWDACQAHLEGACHGGKEKQTQCGRKGGEEEDWTGFSERKTVELDAE
ncbi:hypothetical protein EYF80_034744 [Liparis tanakae]|uniref:Uncharacterized protein n=1 Tax=Liparis tanakae TaxID=230148 RepID=A0A4Z2GN45_9TELE|nr:hypothetical protein EYF80_034744 [Liparis tanakae]